MLYNITLPNQHYQPVTIQAEKCCGYYVHRNVIKIHKRPYWVLTDSVLMIQLGLRFSTRQYARNFAHYLHDNNIVISNHVVIVDNYLPVFICNVHRDIVRLLYTEYMQAI